MKTFLFLFLSSLFCAAETRGYFFEDFEKSSVGEAKVEGFELVQGVATIQSEEKNTFYTLPAHTPYGTTLLDASELYGAHPLSLEILVKPFALDPSVDEEFLDFGGAIVGFTRNGEKGEFSALSYKNEEESVWITTGKEYELSDTGTSAEWIALGIIIDPAQKRWTLYLDGEAILHGLKLVDLPAEVTLPLYLYGHTEHDNSFDEVLITNLSPDEVAEEVERTWSAFTTDSPQQTNRGPKTVSAIKENDKLRQNGKTTADRKTSAAKVVKLETNATLKAGDKTFNQINYTDDNGEEKSVLIYAPIYKDGKKQPVQLTVEADLHLAVGVDLSNLKWVVASLEPEEIKDKEVYLSGDFATGLTQVITLTSEMQNGSEVLVDYYPPK